MSQVRIVTDSAAEISSQEIQELEITVVPWRVQVAGEPVVDGPSLRTEAFYQDAIKRRRSIAVLPPTARQFADAFARLAHETEDIISIHGTPEFGNALAAARQGHLGLLGRCNVAFIDSRFTSRAQGLLVVEAARAARAGAGADDIKLHINGLIPRTYLALYVDALDQLSRRGLLRESRESMGVTATYKPLLLLEEGRLASLQRSRKRGEPVERLVEFAGEFTSLKSLCVLHAQPIPALAALKEQLALGFPGMPIEDHIYGPVLASIVGPAALGLVALEN